MSLARARSAGRSLFLASACGGALTVAPTLGLAAAEATAWRVERGDVRVIVPMKPGGAFDARTQALGGTLQLASGGTKPASLAGELVVELATIDTGISLRNRHLRENYLEVAKGPGFDKAALSEIRVDQAASPEFEGESTFSGVLVLHNVKHRVEGTVALRRAAGALRVLARFPLTLTDFGIQPPEYLGVGVGNRIMVHVTFDAVPVAGGPR